MSETVVHGIDRTTQNHLCGQVEGIGTDAIEPFLEITCPLCRLAMETCGATASSCRCAKAPGHVDAGDPVHGCDPAECTGEWVGTFDESKWNGGPDWRAITLPNFPRENR